MRDIVSATRAAGDFGRPGCVYNVGGGERISLEGALELVQDVSGRRVTIVREEAQKGDMRDTFADTTAAMRDLHFRSTGSLRDGLQAEWEWIQGLA